MAQVMIEINSPRRADCCVTITVMEDVHTPAAHCWKYIREQNMEKSTFGTRIISILLLMFIVP